MKHTLIPILLLTGGILSSMTAHGAVFRIPDGKYFELRSAVRAANNTTEPDTIVLASKGTYRPSGGLTLQNISTPIQIYGQGATIDASAASVGRFATVSENGSLLLADVNIVNVKYTPRQTLFVGGVILNKGFTRVRNVTIAGTRINNPEGVTAGTAFANVGTATLVNVTLSNNKASGTVEGSAFYNTGDASLQNTTVTGNGHLNSNTDIAAVDTSGGTSLVLASSIVAGNGGKGCVGMIDSSGGNVAGDRSCNLEEPSDQANTNPRLQPLADNGSGILTHALRAGSPAIDAGADIVCAPMDARGVPRGQAGGVGVGNHCDSGAFEHRTGADPISPGISGTWYDPQQSGHGVMVEVLPGKRILMTWFVYDPAGNSDWIQASGPIDDGIAKLTAYRVTNGAFPPAFDADKTHTQFWGTVSFVVNGCNRGAFAWSSDVFGYGQGGMRVSHLTRIAGLDCG